MSILNAHAGSLHKISAVEVLLNELTVTWFFNIFDARYFTQCTNFAAVIKNATVLRSREDEDVFLNVTSNAYHPEHTNIARFQISSRDGMRNHQFILSNSAAEKEQRYRANI